MESQLNMQVGFKAELSEQLQLLKERLIKQVNEDQNISTEVEQKSEIMNEKSESQFKKIVKKYKAKKVVSSDINDEFINKSPINQESTAPFIMRVKRNRQDEELDEIYLEYDQKGNFKRVKLVTETSTIQKQLNAITFKPNIEGDYSLGTCKQAFKSNSTLSDDKNKSVRLQRIRLPGSISKCDEAQLKRYCNNILNMKREKHRKDIISQKRYGDRDQSPIKTSLKEEDKENEVEELARDETTLEIIDIKALIERDKKETSDLNYGDKMIEEEVNGEDSNTKYEYFIFTGANELNFNEPRYAQDPNGARRDDSDYDSQDSNREDHDNNDYPDEENEEENEREQKNNYDDCNYGMSYNKERYEDEERAIQKHQKNILSNPVFDKILRKNKNCTYQNSVCQLNQERDQLDFYEQEIVKDDDPEEEEDTDSDLDMY